MFNFSTDIDLLSYEPNLFHDLPFAGQRRMLVNDGVTDGNELSSESEPFGVLSEGDVVIVQSSVSDRGSWGVESVVSDGIILLEYAPVGLKQENELIVECRTFEPQANMVHAELMSAIGIDVDDPDETLDESSVISLTLMKRLEVLGVLAKAYAGAISLVGQNDIVVMKAERYQRAFGEALSGARVLVDVNGDGYADEWRSPGVARLVRV